MTFVNRTSSGCKNRLNAHYAGPIGPTIRLSLVNEQQLLLIINHKGEGGADQHQAAKRSHARRRGGQMRHWMGKTGKKNMVRKRMIEIYTCSYSVLYVYRLANYWAPRLNQEVENGRTRMDDHLGHETVGFLVVCSWLPPGFLMASSGSPLLIAIASFYLPGGSGPIRGALSISGTLL